MGRGLTGAGIVSLAMAGQHQTEMAQAAGDWLLAHPYRGYGEILGGHDKFIYSTFTGARRRPNWAGATGSKCIRRWWNLL